jgi:hypothetical protein
MEKLVEFGGDRPMGARGSRLSWLRSMCSWPTAVQAIRPARFMEPQEEAASPETS